MQNREHRFVGICGIVTVILSMAIGAIKPPPELGAPGSVVVEYFKQYQVHVLVLNYLGLIAFIPFLVVMAYQASIIRRAEGEENWLWILVLLSSAFLCAAAFGVLAMLQGTTYIAADGNHGLAKMASDTGAMWFGLLFVTACSYTGSLAWAILHTHVWPKWIAYLSIISSIASAIASTGTVITHGFLTAGGPMTLIAFGLFWLWLLAFSILIFVRAPNKPSIQ